MPPLRAAVALLALLPAACAPGRAAGPPDPPGVAECRAEARNSDAVRNAWRAANLTGPTEQERTRVNVAEAETRALNDCLRRRGLVRGGGVERVRPPGLL